MDKCCGNGECCAQACEGCIDNGSLSGGTITVNPDPTCIGETITYTISGVTDNGGIERVFCTAKQAIAPGGVTYTWTITKPDGAQETGVGAVATVLADLPGTYSGTFTASPTRTKCPPSDITVGPATGTAIGADLDVDSDNNNGTGLPDRSAAEDAVELTAPGKILCVNDDDDDGNGVPDKDQEPPPVSDNDLVQMVAELEPNAPAGSKWRLIYDAAVVQVYESDRATIVPSGQVFNVPLAPNPKNFWIEGIAPTMAGPATITLDVDLDGDGIFDCSDTVKLTVVKVTDVNVHFSDVETWKVASVLPVTQFPLLHFVTARNQNDVVLQATVVPDVAEVRDAISWSTTTPGIVLTSPAVGTDRRTVKFSSNVANGYRVPIEVQFGGTSCRNLVAWVVSADMTGTVGAPAVTAVFSGGLRNGTSVSAHIEPTGTIHPGQIITDADRPNLAGTNVGPPLSGTNTCGTPLASGVNARWDVSRQIRQRTVTIPAGLSLHCVQTDVSFPVDPVQGNDDAGTSDEDNNPYDISPALGVLLSTDTPGDFGPDQGGLTNGDVGDTYRARVCFREFSRLQVGPPASGVWYRISDYLEWRVDFSFVKRQITEALWGLDTNGDGDLLDDVMESDLGVDVNGDGDMLDPVGYWDDDGTISATDNADCG